MPFILSQMSDLHYLPDLGRLPRYTPEAVSCHVLSFTGCDTAISSPILSFKVAGHSTPN